MGVRFGEFVLDSTLFELRRNGERVALERQVFDVLAHLIEHRDRVVPKEELLDEIWGDRFVSESALTSRIKSARQAIGDDGTTQRYIQTIRGRGYRFVGHVSAQDGQIVPSPDRDAATPREGETHGAPPSGTVTFLFTDVEGSTRLWEQYPSEMHVALQRHDELILAAVEAHGGFVFSSSGDSFAVAFSGVHDAVAASLDAQAALLAEPWPAACPIRVRMGLHVGEARERNRDYFGPAVNKAARIMAGGHGGQILASSAVAAVHTGIEMLDLGEHRLKDLSARERLFQVGGGTFAPLRTLEAVRHNLPVERSQLVGREHEIVQVQALLREHRLVTLLGIGGTGKTRLAGAVAADLAEEFPDGVWFVDLVPANTGNQAAEAIASAAGLQLNGSDLVASLADLIAGRRMLVLLDNCEHITDPVADVVDVLLERTTVVTFLATSREPLQLPDERQVHVAPLAVADDPESPAVQLFSAAAERVGVLVDGGRIPLVADVCAKLDGLPLSIELAAAQLRHLSLDELAERLDRRFDILARGGGGRMRRQASLQAVLQDTWEMLDPDEQQLLLHLAAFPASFSVDDVEGLCSESDVGVAASTLAGLADRSLIAGDGDGRHRLLETVKLFARRAWSETPDPDSFAERHTTWVLEHLDAYEPQDWFTSFELFDWTTGHYDDHRAVEDRLAQAGRTGDLVRLLRALTIAYTYATGTRASAVIERIERHLARLDLSDRERGLLCLVAASAGLPARRPDVISERARESVDLLRSDGAPEELAAALIVGSWMVVFDDFDRAFAMLREAADIADAADAPAVANAALAYMAGHTALDHRVDESLAMLDRLRTRLDDRPFDYADSLYYLFRLADLIIRDPATARQLGESLVAQFPNLAWDGGMGWGLPLCTCLSVAACGDVESTRRMVASAEALSRMTSDDDGLPDLLLPPAALAWRLGYPDGARRWLTAVRHSPKPTANFQLTIMYRQLRGAVGLLADNPLESDSLPALFAEAVEWMNALEPVNA